MQAAYNIIHIGLSLHRYLLAYMQFLLQLVFELLWETELN